MIIPLQNYKNLLNNIISNFDFNLIVLKFGVKYHKRQLDRIWYTAYIPSVYAVYTKSIQAVYQIWSKGNEQLMGIDEVRLDYFVVKE